MTPLNSFVVDSIRGIHPDEAELITRMLHLGAESWLFSYYSANAIDATNIFLRQKITGSRILKPQLDQNHFYFSSYPHKRRPKINIKVASAETEEMPKLFD
jgi:hypothetical protein